MIPEHKKNAVIKALQTAFGVTEVNTMQPLTKRLSGALVLKITVNKRPYVLRVVTRADELGNPAHYFKCMEIAADAGIAPHIYYLNAEDRISITDYIEPQLFSLEDAPTKMATAIRQLHKLSPFGYRINYLDVCDKFVQRLKESHILPDTISEDLFELYARVAETYPRHDQENLVSCHIDLKPDNIIYDGVKPWLIDWEAAFLNDRYIDLAAMANFIVRSEKDENVFLTTYFGSAPTEYQSARFFLMCQVVHMFCFAMCTMSAAADVPIDEEVSTVGFRECHDRLWRCEINLGDNTEKLKYGWVHMEQLMLNMKSGRFNDSLRIVSAGQ